MYNTRIALIALLILQSLHSHAQKYSWYGAVTDTNRAIIYRTDFDKADENNKDWEYPIEEPKDSLFYAYIKDGTLEITNNSVGSTTAAGFTLMFDYSKDFEIEFRARLEKKYKGETALLFWGRDTTVNIYNGQFLYFYQDASFHLTFCTGKGTAPCEHKRTRNEYSWYTDKGGYNTYVIRKIKDRYYLFINKEYSHRSDYIPLNGQLFGFGTGSKSVASLDYIQVSYLLLD